MIRKLIVLAALFSMPVASWGAPLVTLDPGHGGRFSGATNCKYSFGSNSCLEEADVNLDIALRAERILRGWGFRVRMTRTTDSLVNSPERDIDTWNDASAGNRTFYKDGRADVRDDLQARVNVTDCDTRETYCAGGAAQSDVFLSIHNNACGCGARGTETYHAGSSQGRALAERVQNAALQAGGRPNRGVRAEGFYVIRYTRAPAALLESAFLDNDEEARLLRDANFREQLALGAARGVARYLTSREVGRRHAELGGRFGAQVAEEFEIPGGWVSRHQHGEFFWRPDHGPFVAYGAILQKYIQTGGAPSWGLPTTDEIGVTGGRASYFERARFYWSDATQAHVTYGAILGKYLELNGTDGFMRLPISDEEGIPGGRVSRFQGGEIFWSPETGAHAVYGGILNKYVNNGGAGRWGVPITDEIDVTGGRASHFQRGHIYWSSTTHAQITYGGILQKYLALGGPDSALKLPTTDEIDVAGGRATFFQGGRIYWSPSTQAQPIYGSILDKYLQLGGPDGFLGLPVQEEINAGIGRVSAFQHGRVYWSQLTSAHEVHGAILGTYLGAGGADSTLGLPMSDELLTPQGARSNFQGGHITWDRVTGETAIHRA